MFKNSYGRNTIIRRLLWMMTAVMLIIGAAFAAGSVSDSDDEFFSRFAGMEWTFSSGAGAWSTSLRIQPDGTFAGEFHDSEMGEQDDAYPDGTVYYCEFTGKFSSAIRENENTWKLHVEEVKQKEETGTEIIEDGIRFVATSSYGIEAGDEMKIYRPGTPLDGFTDSMKFWAHLYDAEMQNRSALSDWFLYSEKQDAGFVGVLSDAGVSIASPWENLTADQMKALTALPLNLPEGAGQTAYRWYRMDSIAEVQFTWKDGDYCFRAQNAAPEEGTSKDISGLYFTWENERPISVDGNTGSIGLVQSGTGSWVERCIWYDTARQTVYSLSVTASDIDGLDLEAIAEQIVSTKK